MRISGTAIIKFISIPVRNEEENIPELKWVVRWSKIVQYYPSIVQALPGSISFV